MLVQLVHFCESGLDMFCVVDIVFDPETYIWFVTVAFVGVISSSHCLFGLSRRRSPTYAWTRDARDYEIVDAFPENNDAFL